MKVHSHLSPVNSHIVEKIMEDALRVCISYGGGMGGARQVFFAESVKWYNGMGTFILCGKDRRVITVNKRFVVAIEPGYDIYEQVIDHENEYYDTTKDYVRRGAYHSYKGLLDYDSHKGSVRSRNGVTFHDVTEIIDEDFVVCMK